jgi:D-galactarolactone cycloisomerase
MTSTAPKIIRIEGFEIACRLSEAIGNCRQMFDSRSSLIVAVTTDAGVTGFGETWAFPGPAGEFAREVFAPRIIGCDATLPRTAWQIMAARLGYDRRGVSHMAISALDIALWDAAGLTLGRPVHALLGGALRSKIQAYASGPFMMLGSDPYRDFLIDVETYLRAGFRAIKMRMGTQPRRDGELASSVRNLIGPQMPLMVDLNEGFTVQGALDIASRLSEADLVWLEEPIVHDDLPGYRRLAEKLPMGLAGGEALFGLAAYRDYIADGIFDFVQPDLALCGGFTEGMRIAALADAFGSQVVPHVWGSIVNFQASLHFAACLTERRGSVRSPLFEFDPSENPLRTTFASHELDSAGCISVPDSPGLGLQLKVEQLLPLVVRHWAVE